ncbi:MAG: FtsX-like permease family protein [Bacteroidales bacterium]|nr:FtsX-like permease family protein [Bacteroidales bacterium]
MKLFKTALKSLLGNGLKTWLTVFVLSVSFVLIIFMQGLLEGWSRQAVSDAIAWEIAGGQYWSEAYDPYDPFSLDSCARDIPDQLMPAAESGLLEAVLISQGTIYPQGRMQGVILKGIDPEQQIVKLPTRLLAGEGPEIPVIIGAQMAKQAHLKENDLVTLRWRDANGTFEAADLRVAGIFVTTVPAIDNGQIWLALDKLQSMMLRENQASILIASPDYEAQQLEGWLFKDVEKLSSNTIAMVKAKSMGMAIFYLIFLLLALLAIFDTQTLAIFRRQREIGTLVALGMTRKQVQWLFTLEGSLNALLAIALGCLYGIPLFIYLSMNGLSFPIDISEFGLPVSDVMYPYYSLKLIVGTIVFILLCTALVSYLPARQIARMNPTEAIRGKMH